MFLSSYAWVFTLALAAVSGGLCYLLSLTFKAKEVSDYDRRYGRGAEGPILNGTLAALGAGLVSLLMLRVCVYYGMPVQQDSLGGYWWYAALTLVPALVGGLIASSASRVSISAAALAAVALFAWPGLNHALNDWGPGNGQRRATLVNVKVASTDSKIPPSDPDHMVLVSKSIAAHLGQAALGQYATRYKVDPESYILQSVQGHRYWIGVITLTNFKDTWNFGDAYSPGFVVVDAENPHAEAVVKDGFKIRLFEDQAWNLNLQRYLYRYHGLTDGHLDDPGIEIDDNWKPHYTMGYVRKAFGNVAGKKLEKVVVVSAEGDKPEVQIYDPANPTEREKFKWVDRTVSQELVTEWASDWGVWAQSYAKENPWPVWWGADTTGTMKPEDIELCYTTGAENVWIVPMTSRNSDQAVQGIMVFESNRNEGVFYPGLSKFLLPNSAKKTFENVAINGVKYPVEHLQLMSIYGRLTWVCIYGADQKVGRSFAGLGFMDASSQNSADVIVAVDKESALSSYRSHIARVDSDHTKISKEAKPPKTVSGKIQRVAPLSIKGLLSDSYIFKIEGVKGKSFIVTREIYPDIALIKEGDEVSITYIDMDMRECPVSSLKCSQLD